VAIAHERDERIKRLTGKMDRVLVDAPCSGLGTLRRNPDLKWRQTPQAIAELQAKQRAILDSAARLLKPGGRLVYATCSVLPDENEGVADAFSASHPEFQPVSVPLLLTRLLGANAAHAPQDNPHDGEGLTVSAAAQALCHGNHLRLWPHRHNTDGFFAAVWERTY
jgi:16S rRNA (cytosine967-C5)-methyltransferase